MAGVSLKDPNLNEIRIILIIIKNNQRKMRDIAIFRKFPPISLKISHDFYRQSSRIPLKIFNFLSSINPPKSLRILQGIFGKSLRNPCRNFPFSSAWILDSLLTQISASIPHRIHMILPAGLNRY